MSHQSFPFDADFESAIEEILLPEISRYLSTDTAMVVQKELTTPNGNYRPDALLLRGAEIMAIECDGKDFHTGHTNELYDLWRDAFLLFHDQVDFIYRFRGREIHYFLSDIIYLLAKEKPQFFDKEKVKRLSTNFTEYFHQRTERKQDNEILIEFHDLEEEKLPTDRRQRGFYYSYRDKKDWFPDFGPEALLLGELFPGSSAKQLMEQFGSFRLMGDDLFAEVERQKPGALLKYIHFFKNDFHYIGEKGELIKKYKLLAGYPVEQNTVKQFVEKATYQEQNIAVWNEVVKKVIPLENIPQSLKWTEVDAIVAAIKWMKGHQNHVVVFFPNEGDSHLFDVLEGYEDRFIEIHSGSYVHIGRPESLEFVQVSGWPDTGFFRLNFETIAPIQLEFDEDENWVPGEQENEVRVPVEPKTYQILLEFRPGKYDEEPFKKEKHERIVKRYTGGHLLFFRNCSDHHPVFKIV